MRPLIKTTSLAAGALGLGLIALLAATTSCNVDGYCLDCYDAQGGTIFDGGGGNDDGDVPDDGGGDFDACVPSGVEVCDGLDNDCNGQIDADDDGLTGVGGSCGTDMGECETGTTECVDGEIVCGGGAINPDFESCNQLDDDCDGFTDENNPGGGLICGTNLGECEAGVQTCTDGMIECLGEVTGGSESCNGLDDDCDGMFDEGITLAGDCGPTSDDGQCVFGVQTCVGGSIQCVGAVFPELEVCDNIDHDCDGDPLNGFNLATDIRNCVTCGNVCEGFNAFWQCNNGCEVAACETNFFDLNNNDADGCEFGPCVFQGNEICNGQDDDCDGLIDEGVNTNPPILCDQDGECAGATATCDSMLGQFVCTYGATVSTDVNGNIINELTCDDLDNDCDGRTDEGFTVLNNGIQRSKGQTCTDGEIGVCLDTATVVCTADETGVECPVVDVLNPGNAPAETCNNIDDNCDGIVDNGDIQEWVDLGGGLEVMKYEASRPDSTDTEQGFAITGAVCSEANRVPWTNVTQPEAEAACARIGARLCTETEWQNACETDNIGPGVQGADGFIVFEAEETGFVVNTANTDGDVWEENQNVNGFSGTGAMEVPDAPNTTTQTALTNSPHLSYTVNFTQTGDHYIWVRMLTQSNAANSFWFAFDDSDGNLAGSALVGQGGNHDEWFWESDFQDGSRMTFNVPATGVRTLDFYNREDETYIDKIIITTDINFVPNGPGGADQCEWSYATNCRTYSENTCNGEDFDGVPGGADDDIMLATGSMAQCFADWEVTPGDGNAPFDMSGNIKEWTAERAVGVNPIRGGSFNNTEVGISCQFDFLTADDNFFLPNIGFRCCR